MRKRVCAELVRERSILMRERVRIELFRVGVECRSLDVYVGR